MRTAAILLVLAAACAPAPPPAAGPASMPAQAAAPAASLVGTWILTQLNGHDLPAPSPGEPNVTIERASLALQEGGGSILTIAAHRAGDPVMDRTQRGTYTAEGGTLTTTPDGGEPMRFTYTLAGPTLTLRDESGAVYTLTRG